MQFLEIILHANPCKPRRKHAKQASANSEVAPRRQTTIHFHKLYMTNLKQGSHPKFLLTHHPKTLSCIQGIKLTRRRFACSNSSKRSPPVLDLPILALGLHYEKERNRKDQNKIQSDFNNTPQRNKETPLRNKQKNPLKKKQKKKKNWERKKNRDHTTKGHPTRLHFSKSGSTYHGYKQQPRVSNLIAATCGSSYQ